jgi:hypothetical protein
MPSAGRLIEIQTITVKTTPTAITLGRAEKIESKIE